MRSSLLLAITLFGSCAHQSPGTPAGPASTSVERYSLDTHGVNGVSDLTHAEGASPAQWFAIPERQRVILPLVLGEGVPRLAADPIPLSGVPDGEDTESIAFLGSKNGAPTFAIGTESLADDRDHDDILIAKLENGTARVDRTIPIAYSKWAFKADRNHGIEALCALGDSLLFAGEAVMTEGDMRFAPVGILNGQDVIAAYRLQLTSPRGRISAIACRKTTDDQIEALAVERHYGIGRLIRFIVPANDNGGGAPPILTPTVVVDLAATLKPLPNVEGVAFGPEGIVYLVTDNQTGIVVGPTEIIRLKLPEAAASTR